MTQELGPFQFQLARSLGRTLAELHGGWRPELGIPEREYIAWRAFAAYEGAMRQIGRA